MGIGRLRVEPPPQLQSRCWERRDSRKILCEFFQFYVRGEHRSFFSWRHSAKHWGEGLTALPCKTLQQFSPHLRTAESSRWPLRPWASPTPSSALYFHSSSQHDLTYSLPQESTFQSCPADASCVFLFASIYPPNSLRALVSTNTLSSDLLSHRQ